MAERATIARPYAKAAFEYARDAQALAAWSRWAQDRRAEIVADPRVQALIQDPEAHRAAVAGFVLDVAGEQLDAGVQNFMRVLAENHRLPLLPEIAALYEAARSEIENTVDVEVDLGGRARFRAGGEARAAVAARLKQRVRMHNSVDPALLGGAVIRAGDLVIDGSIKGRLERLNGLTARIRRGP